MKTTIRTKLLLGFTVIVALLAAGYLVAEYRLDKIRRATSKIQEEWTEWNLTNQAQASLEETIGTLAKYIISGDETEKNEIRQSLQAGLESINHLEHLQHGEMGRILEEELHTKAELGWVSVFNRDFADMESLLNHLLALSDPKANPQATQLFDEANERSHKIITNLTQFREIAQSALDRSFQTTRQEENLSDRILLVNVLGMITLSLVFSLLISRSIARSISNLKKRSKQIGRGNFDYPAVDSSGDEIADLDRTLQRTAFNLKRLFGNLEGIVREKEGELQQAQCLAAIGQMVSVVAHDFRNPLQNIYMSVDTLRNELGPDKEKMEVLEEIDHSVTLLNGIVSELLDYSRPVHPKYSSTSIRDIVRGALDSLSSKLQDINVEVALEHEDREIFVDAGMMNRVLVNIISNAADAITNGGRLRVRSRFVDSNGDSRLTLSIADNGCGIPEEYLDRVYEPFFTTKPQGTGLGIPICKKIIDAHNGRLTIKSKAMVGTTVEIALPIGNPSSS